MRNYFVENRMFLIQGGFGKIKEVDLFEENKIILFCLDKYFYSYFRKNLF